MKKRLVSFAQGKNSHSGNPDQLDRAGQTILQLLNKAAGVAEENSRHAIETAQRLAHQLRAAENRIAELEGEVAAYQEQAERASNGCTGQRLGPEAVVKAQRVAERCSIRRAAKRHGKLSHGCRIFCRINKCGSGLTVSNRRGRY